MHKIVFKAICGEHTQHVELSQPNGGSGSWHIYVDKYYYGRVAFVNGEWVDLDSRLDKEDTDAVIERIIEYNKGLD